MNAPIRRVVLDPATLTEAQAAAGRLVRMLDLWGTTITSDILDGHLRSVVWTRSEADSIRLVSVLATRHVYAKYTIAHDCDLAHDYVTIRWRKLT
jgi:hypothetical protein